MHVSGACVWEGACMWVDMCMHVGVRGHGQVGRGESVHADGGYVWGLLLGRWG